MKPSNYGLFHDEFRPHQEDSINWGLSIGRSQKSVGILQACTGCHRIGQPILMYDGSIAPIEVIKKGDLLMGTNSESRRVIRIIRGFGQMYEVKPTKGEPFVVNEDHILTLVRTNRTSKEKHKRVRSDCKDGEIVDVSIRAWLSWSKGYKHIYKLFRVPIEFSGQQNLPIDPYFLGVLLGDGHLGSGSIAVTTMDDPIVNELYAQAEKYKLYIRIDNSRSSGRAKIYSIHAGRTGGRAHALLKQLSDLELRGRTSGDKFIPALYKTANRRDRLSLLAGLMDTDGYLSSGLYYDYISKSKRLANDVAFVARSLGLSAYVKMTTKRCQTGHQGTYFRVGISGDVSIVPCRIPRKKRIEPRRQKKSVLRTGFTVEKLGKEQFFGFGLDGDGRYLLGDFTVTHNSGKTAVAKAVASQYSVTALCRTKALQFENYGQLYDFDVLYGRSNYRCLHAKDRRTAADCLYAEKGMNKCPIATECLYLKQRLLVQMSDCRSLNYYYWLVAQWPKLNKTEYLFMDECHELPDLVTEWSGISMTEPQRAEWELPEFPIIEDTTGLLGKSQKVNTTEAALNWLIKSHAILGARYKWLSQRKFIDKEYLRAARKCERMGFKVRSAKFALAALQKDSDWFIRSGPKVGRIAHKGRVYKVPGLTAKPLTSRHHFKTYFDYPNMILMSATIGDFDTLAEELGIDKWKLSIRDVPSQWPPSSRPVYTFEDAPRMGHNSSDEDYSEQARIIARCIMGCPPNWSGIIHVTRKVEAPKLADRLARRGLQDRIVVMPQLSTDKQMKWWIDYKRKINNAIVVSWAWTEGVDLGEEKICINAKVPFPSLAEPFEKARLDRSHGMFYQRTAWKLEQSLGRTRRGRQEDYDSDGEHRGFVAIVDENWRRVRNFISSTLREAIVEV